MYLILYPTGMAQRKRAGLIILRTLVRSQLPAFSICRFSETDGHSSSDPKQEQHLTGVAQGQRAGLITSRSYDRNVPPVFIIQAGLSEHASAVSTATIHRDGAVVSARGS